MLNLLRLQNIKAANILNAFILHSTILLLIIKSWIYAKENEPEQPYPQTLNLKF